MFIRSKLYEKRCVKDEQRKAHRFMRESSRTAREPMQGNSSGSRQPLDPGFVRTQKLNDTPEAYYNTDCGNKKVCAPITALVSLRGLLLTTGCKADAAAEPRGCNEPVSERVQLHERPVREHGRVPRIDLRERREGALLISSQLVSCLSIWL